MTQFQFGLAILFTISYCSFSEAKPRAWNDVVQAAKYEGLVQNIEPPEGTPAFCRDLECPKFKTMRHYKNFQLRCYGGYDWVTTNVTDLDYEKASREAFMRLFNYIQGENVKKMKIKMTAPVKVNINPGEGPFCADTYIMSFFVPFELQGKAPAPSKTNVYLSNSPSECFYVRFFPGFAKKEDVIENALALTSDLKKAGVEDAMTKTYWFAGYDSPFQIEDRHNEIWFLQNQK